MNKIIVIGSHALNRHISSFREYPSDYDMIGDIDTVINFIKTIDNIKSVRPIDNGKKMIVKADSIYEFKIIDSDVDRELFTFISNDSGTIFDGDMMYPSLNILYSLKETHKFLRNSPHFLKTRTDILFLKSIGCSIPDNFMSLFKKIERDTYNYSHPNLNQNKDNFFNDIIEYKYDHDTIHEAVKVNEKPAYQNFIKDGSEVLCSKKKFFECSEYIRNCAVLEESYVLALERSIIPHGTDPKKAFDIALIKVCSSITSGWFRDWAWENYDNVQDMYCDSFFYKFNHALINNQIKPFKKS